VRTLEHNQTQFKLDTLVDWQPVKEITHRRDATYLQQTNTELSRT